MVVQGKPASNQQVRHLHHSEQLHEVKQRGEIGLKLALLHLPLEDTAVCFIEAGKFMALVLKRLHSPKAGQRLLEATREERPNPLDGLAERRQPSSQVAGDD